MPPKSGSTFGLRDGLHQSEEKAEAGHDDPLSRTRYFGLA